MKKIDIAQAIAILANFGVIAGIVFLALEINQNNQQLSSQARYNYYEGRVQLTRDLALNGELSAALLKALEGEPLSPLEQTRIFAYGQAAFSAWEYEYWEYSREQITPEEFNIPAKRARFEALSPALGATWDLYSRDAPKEFVEFMESEVIGE